MRAAKLIDILKLSLERQKKASYKQNCEQNLKFSIAQIPRWKELSPVT